MRQFYFCWPPIVQTPSAQSVFALPWSHYARSLAVQNRAVRTFYEAEALRGGWSVRQLNRQISTQYFERSPRVRRKLVAGVTTKASIPEQEMKDPMVLEFLNFSFLARQKRRQRTVPD
jgi:predicted nuclease of restriction endonuclease-like (RecB) superfamily